MLKLKNHFARYGYPDRLISDNGPQFVSSEFRKFANDWDFEHRTSSPGNSKDNGKVESAVKTAKNLLHKALSARTDPYIAILDYRNTPTQGMESNPAQRLMNRRTRTLLPTTKTLLYPRALQSERDIQQLNGRQFQQSKYYNHARDLPTHHRNLTKDHIRWKHPMETPVEEIFTTLGKPRRTLIPRKYQIQHLIEVLRISQHQLGRPNRPLLSMLRKPQQSHLRHQSHPRQQPGLGALDGPSVSERLRTTDQILLKDMS